MYERAEAFRVYFDVDLENISMHNLITFLKHPKCRKLESIAELPLLFVEDYSKGYDNIMMLTNSSFSTFQNRATPATGDEDTTFPTSPTSENGTQPSSTPETRHITQTQETRYVQTNPQSNVSRAADASNSLPQTCDRDQSPTGPTTDPVTDSSSHPPGQTGNVGGSLLNKNTGTVYPVVENTGHDRDREGIG